MCLLLGIPRALAMASVSKDGSRAIRAPWIPLPWRLSAYSWKAQHKGSGEKSSQTWSTDWGYWKLRTGSISHHGSSKTLFSHSSMYIQVPPPHSYNIGEATKATKLSLFLWESCCGGIWLQSGPEISTAEGNTVTDLPPTLRSMSLIHFITLWHVQTMGSRSWFSHLTRRACRACKQHNTQITALELMWHRERSGKDEGPAEIMCAWSYGA